MANQVATAARWASARWIVMAGLVLAPLAIVSADAPDDQDEPPVKSPAPSRPDLTDPILCLSVRGFREFVPREKTEISRDEKLHVYYEPFNYLIARNTEGKTYRAHLSQDVRIRKAGSDRVLQERRAIVDYDPESSDPPTSFYMLMILELKQYPLGSYEADLVLRDELAEGKPETIRTIAFQVVSPSDSPPSDP